MGQSYPDMTILGISTGYPQDVNLGDTPKSMILGGRSMDPLWISRSGQVPISRSDHLGMIPFGDVQDYPILHHGDEIRSPYRRPGSGMKD